MKVAIQDEYCTLDCSNPTSVNVVMVRSMKAFNYTKAKESFLG